MLLPPLHLSDLPPSFPSLLYANLPLSSKLSPKLYSPLPPVGPLFPVDMFDLTKGNRRSVSALDVLMDLKLSPSSSSRESLQFLLLRSSLPFQMMHILKRILPTLFPPSLHQNVFPLLLTLEVMMVMVVRKEIYKSLLQLDKLPQWTRPCGLKPRVRRGVVKS